MNQIFVLWTFVCSSLIFGLVHAQDTGSPLEAPIITDAVFSSITANSIIVTFDKDTDRGGKKGEFDCTELFENTGYGSNAFCVWLDNSHVVIFLGCSATVVPGAQVTLLPDVLRSLDQTSPFSEAQSYPISPPEILPEPTVIVNGPTFVSVCGNGAFNGVQSWGRGARELTEYSWSIESDIGEDDPDLPGIRALLPATTTDKSFTFFKSDLLEKFDVGRTYRLNLTATNYFGESAQNYLDMFVTQKAAPTVLIEPSYLKVTHRDELKLHGTTLRPPPQESFECSGFEEEKIVYTWNRIEGHPFPLNLETANTRELFIPANTLLPGETYRFELRAAYSETPSLFGYSIATVVVERTPIKAFITGGDRLFTLGVRDLILDASASIDYDEDPAPMTYEWSCYDMLKEGECFGAEMSEFQPQAATFRVPATALTIGQYNFTVKASKPNREPGYHSVMIYTNGRGPDVSIASPLEVSPNEQVALLGSSLSNPTNGAVSYRWFVVVGDLDLSPFENCNIEYEDKELATCRNAQNIVINPHVLTTGTDYRFRLEATNSFGTGWAEVTLHINEKPAGGCCAVAPSTSGAAYTETFTMQCTHWEDLTPPLRYVFTRKTEGRDPEPVQINVGRSNKDSTSFLLPPGKSTVSALIYDARGASTEVRIQMQATLDPSLSTFEAKLAYLSNALERAQYESDIPLQLQIIDFLTEVISGETPSTQLRDMLIANIIDTPTEISIDTTRDKVVSLAAITSVTYEITERSHTKIVNFLPVLSNSFETHGVHPETAQGFAQLIQNLILSAPTRSLSLTRQYRKSLNSLVIGLLKDATAGEASQTYKSDLVTIYIRKDIIALFTSMATSGVNVQLPAALMESFTAANIGELGGSIIIIQDNVYGFDSTNLSSPVVGISLWNGNQELEVADLTEAIEITVPTKTALAHNFSVPTCQYWSTIQWSSDGCTVKAYTPSSTVCACTHLSDWSVSIQPTPPIFVPGGRAPVVSNFEKPMDPHGDFITTEMVVLILFAAAIAIVLISVVALLKGRRPRKLKNDDPFYGIGGVDDGDEDEMRSQASTEEDVRDFSIAEPGEFGLIDSEEDLQDYSIGLLDENDDLFEGEEHNGRTNGISRLSRLGPGGNGGYGSSSTHRDSFAAEYDLDSPRNPQATKPQTSTRIARERDTTQQRPRASPRYAPSSTRITAGATASRETSSSRTMSSTRRLNADAS